MDRPRLVRHARLRRERGSDQSMLLYPERALLLNATAARIVSRCTGALTVAEIVHELESEYPEAGTEDIARDVYELLEELSARRLLEAGAEAGPAPVRPARVAERSPSFGMPRPYTLVAELTYACPLRCAYCSNPTELVRYPARLNTDDWRRVLGEAEALGAVHASFTGGEPLLYEGLEGLVAEATRLGLYTNLITSGVPLERARLFALAEAGLPHVQLSIQDVDAAAAGEIAGRSLLCEKLSVARWVKEAGLSLTLNFVLHRRNIDRASEFIALAGDLGAERVELANVQYLGWALYNRGELMPTESQLEAARTSVQSARERSSGRLEIVHVMPDYYSGEPRACMAGWGNEYLVVGPDGFVRPCQAAHGLGLETWNVREHGLSDIWQASPIFNAFRGEAWMPEPCRSCERRAIDFGGCRCQAHALTGDAGRTDPACERSLDHRLVQSARLMDRPAPGRLRLRQWSHDRTRSS